MGLAIAIAHAPFAPGRKEGLKALLEQLPGVHPCVFHSEIPEHSTSWARRIWSWAANVHADDHVLVLNDDIELIPGFVPILKALIEAFPTEFLSLHPQGPIVQQLAQQGERVVRFYDYTGPAVVFAPGQAADAVDFWDANPALKNVLNLNEDNVAAQWMWDRQRPAFAPLPALVRHITDIRSTLGYDDHVDRVTTVAWDESWWPEGTFEHIASPDFWRPKTLPPLIQNPWFPMSELDRRRKLRRGFVEWKPCAFCMKEPGKFASDQTGVAIGQRCAEAIVEGVAGEKARMQT